MSTPAERVFTLSRLRAQQLEARVTDEVHVMASEQSRPQLSAVRRRLQLRASDCGRQQQTVWTL